MLASITQFCSLMVVNLLRAAKKDETPVQMSIPSIYRLLSFLLYRLLSLCFIDVYPFYFIDVYPFHLLTSIPSIALEHR